ncbi:hypothetical protein [Nitrosopumilus sp. S4]
MTSLTLAKVIATVQTNQVGLIGLALPDFLLIQNKKERMELLGFQTSTKTTNLPQKVFLCH